VYYKHGTGVSMAKWPHGIWDVF